MKLTFCSDWAALISSRSEQEEENLEKTVFTVRDVTDDSVTRRTKRPALLISSTSWTGEDRRIKLLPFLLPFPFLNISLLKTSLSVMCLKEFSIFFYHFKRWLFYFIYTPNFLSSEDEDFSVLLKALEGTRSSYTHVSSLLGLRRACFHQSTKAWSEEELRCHL